MSSNYKTPIEALTEGASGIVIARPEIAGHGNTSGWVKRASPGSFSLLHLGAKVRLHLPLPGGPWDTGQSLMHWTGDGTCWECLNLGSNLICNFLARYLLLGKSFKFSVPKLPHFIKWR